MNTRRTRARTTASYREDEIARAAALAEPQPAEPPAVAEEITFTARTERFDWGAIAEEPAARGLARVRALISSAECSALRDLYPQGERYEHDVRIDDDRGREVYARLAPIVNRWNELIEDARRWPATHAAFEREFQSAGHGRTSPILLRYEPGGFNGFTATSTARSSSRCRWLSAWGRRGSATAATSRSSTIARASASASARSRPTSATR